ncbi:MAG: hypothetical protein NT027_12905 [Proteobacteria bacterium]|nr:hypothetical protein [Pseudomonadota bacterium]
MTEEKRQKLGSNEFRSEDDISNGKMRYIFGTWQEASKELTPTDAVEICQSAMKAQELLATYPQDKILRTLKKLQIVWADRQSSYRIQAAKDLPKITGFSQQMIDLALEELAATLDTAELQRKLLHETNGVPLTPEYKYNVTSKTILSAFPIGSVFHVLSGNVFLVGVGSWLEGIITRNVSILKMSSNETYFMPLFLKSLNEVDQDGILSKTVAAIDIKSSNHQVIEVFKQNVDGIVIWGGEDAVKTYRNGLPARTRVVVFGPKVSFAIVTKKGLESQGIQTVANNLANEIAIWDQNACTAPQVCFVEGKDQCNLLLSALKTAMIEVTNKIPSGSPPPDTAAEIRKIRGVREIAEARGEGQLLESSHRNVDWTIYQDNSLSMDLSPLHRTLRLTPIQSMNDVFELAAPMRGYLQTVGVAADPFEYQKLFHELSRLGAQRCFELGAMFAGEIDDPHDGAYDLPQLLNISVSRLKKTTSSGQTKDSFLANDPSLTQAEGIDPWDHHYARQEIIDSRLRQIVDAAKKSSFYSKKFAGIEIDSAKDLQKLPLLTRGEWTDKMLPASRDLLTKSMQGGFITQSGGSTGEPKYSYFAKDEWESMVLYAGRIFRAMGFRSSDRIGYLMSNADLYGGFVSFNAVAFGLGAQSYSFGPTPSFSVFRHAFEAFHINALIGFPPTIMSLLRQLNEQGTKIKLDKVMFSGSPISQIDRKWLKEKTGCGTIASVIGTTEANHIAYQCDEQMGTTFHHTCDDYNYMELVDEQGSLSKQGEFGRIVITNMHKTTAPVIRYLNGDKAKWVANTCACGRLDRVIDYQGRWDSIICIANTNIDYNDVRRVLEREGVSLVQLNAAFINGKEQLDIVCESHEKIDPQKMLQILSNELRDFQIESAILSTTLKVVGIGEIPRNPRTGKIKEINDTRNTL